MLAVAGLDLFDGQVFCLCVSPQNTIIIETRYRFLHQALKSEHQDDVNYKEVIYAQLCNCKDVVGYGTNDNRIEEAKEKCKWSNNMEWLDASDTSRESIIIQHRHPFAEGVIYACFQKQGAANVSGPTGGPPDGPPGQNQQSSQGQSSKVTSAPEVSSQGQAPGVSGGKGVGLSGMAAQVAGSSGQGSGGTGLGGLGTGGQQKVQFGGFQTGGLESYGIGQGGQSKGGTGKGNTGTTVPSTTTTTKQTTFRQQTGGTSGSSTNAAATTTTNVPSFNEHKQTLDSFLVDLDNFNDKSSQQYADALTQLAQMYLQREHVKGITKVNEAMIFKDVKAHFKTKELQDQYATQYWSLMESHKRIMDKIEAEQQAQVEPKPSAKRGYHEISSSQDPATSSLDPATVIKPASTKMKLSVLEDEDNLQEIRKSADKSLKSPKKKDIQPPSKASKKLGSQISSFFPYAQTTRQLSPLQKELQFKIFKESFQQMKNVTKEQCETYMIEHFSFKNTKVIMDACIFTPGQLIVMLRYYNEMLLISKAKNEKKFIVTQDDFVNDLTKFAEMGYFGPDIDKKSIQNNLVVLHKSLKEAKKSRVYVNRKADKANEVKGAAGDKEKRERQKVSKNYRGQLQWSQLTRANRNAIMASTDPKLDGTIKYIRKQLNAKGKGGAKNNNSVELQPIDIFHIQGALRGFAKDTLKCVEQGKMEEFFLQDEQLIVIAIMLCQVDIDTLATKTPEEKQGKFKSQKRMASIMEKIVKHSHDLSQVVIKLKSFDFLQAFSFTDILLSHGLNVLLKAVLDNDQIKDPGFPLVNTALHHGCRDISRMCRMSTSEDDPRQESLGKHLYKFFGHYLQYSNSEMKDIVSILSIPQFRKLCTVFVEKKQGWVQIMDMCWFIDPRLPVNLDTIDSILEFIMLHPKGLPVFKKWNTWKNAIPGLAFENVFQVLGVIANMNREEFDEWYAKNPVETWIKIIDTSLYEYSQFSIDYTTAELAKIEEYFLKMLPFEDYGWASVDRCPMEVYMRAMMKNDPRIKYDPWQVVHAQIIVSKKMNLFHLPPGQGKSYIMAMVYTYLTEVDSQVVAILLSSEQLKKQFLGMIKYVLPGVKMNVITYESLVTINADHRYDTVIIDEIDFLIRERTLVRIGQQLATVASLNEYFGKNNFVAEIKGITANTDPCIRDFGAKFWGWHQRDNLDEHTAKSFRSFYDGTDDDIDVHVEPCVDEKDLIEKCWKMIERHINTDNSAFLFGEQGEVEQINKQLKTYDPIVISTKQTQIEHLNAELQRAAESKRALITSWDLIMQRGMSIPFVHQCPTFLTKKIYFWNDLVQIGGRSGRRRGQLIVYYFVIGCKNVAQYLDTLKSNTMNDMFDDIATICQIVDEVIQNHFQVGFNADDLKRVNHFIFQTKEKIQLMKPGVFQDRFMNMIQTLTSNKKVGSLFSGVTTGGVKTKLPDYEGEEVDEEEEEQEEEEVLEEEGDDGDGDVIMGFEEEKSSKGRKKSGSGTESEDFDPDNQFMSAAIYYRDNMSQQHVKDFPLLAGAVRDVLEGKQLHYFQKLALVAQKELMAFNGITWEWPFGGGTEEPEEDDPMDNFISIAPRHQ